MNLKTVSYYKSRDQIHTKALDKCLNSSLISPKHKGNFKLNSQLHKKSQYISKILKWKQVVCRNYQRIPKTWYPMRSKTIHTKQVKILIRGQNREFQNSKTPEKVFTTKTHS